MDALKRDWPTYVQTLLQVLCYIAGDRGWLSPETAMAIMGLLAVGGTNGGHRLKRGAVVAAVAFLCAVGCTPAERAGVPVLSTIDAVGRGVSKVLGWCDDAGADEKTLARAIAAYEQKNYREAVVLAAEMVKNLRAAGAEVPEETELMLRLVEGAMAAQAIDDAMSALSGPAP